LGCSDHDVANRTRAGDDHHRTIPGLHRLKTKNIRRLHRLHRLRTKNS
jgi:hypothetical protein